MKTPRRNVVELPMARVLGPMRDRIRHLAQDTEKVFIGVHAEERMWERGITAQEVFHALRFGEIEGVPWIEPDSDDRACKVVYRPRGSRAFGVVTIVVTNNDELFVKTVEWEDER